MKLIAKDFVRLRRDVKRRTLRAIPTEGNYKLEMVLERANDTVQVGSDRKTRIEQAKKAYRLSRRTEISSDKTYLLLDDVWTTGASMEAVIKALKSAGARKIIGAVLLTGR